MSQAKASVLEFMHPGAIEALYYNAEPSVSLPPLSRGANALKTVLVPTEDIFDLYDNAPCGYHSLDERGAFIDINETELRWLGYRRDELIGRKLYEILTSASVETLKAAFPRFKQRGWISDLEIEFVRKDGTTFPVRLSATAVRDIDGNYLMSRSAVCDITEHKQMEEMRLRCAQQAALRYDVEAALGHKNSPLQEILTHCSEALVRHLDAAFARIWTLNEQDDVLVLRASAGMPTPLDDGHIRVPVGTYKIGKIARDHQPYITNDVQSDPNLLEKEWIKRMEMTSFAGYPLIAGNKLVGVMSMFARQELAPDTLNTLGSVATIIAQTIERKRIEESLNQTRELLCQSQKMEAIGRLACGIAHDFNNLLTVILGYSEIALNRIDQDSPIRGALQEITRAGKRASAFTHQILAFSRKEASQPQVLNLNEVIGELQKLIGRVIGEDIEMTTSLNSNLGEVEADPGQVEQIILNLVVNARDAMPNGGKLILETANVVLDESYTSDHLDVQPGPYVMISVSDTGMGMSRDIQSRIFEPFFTTKASGKGTGLGLSTVQEIARENGGHVGVYSESGRGTTFKVYLPRANNTYKIEATQPIHIEPSEGSETVLLVEDDNTVRMLVRSILQGRGYKVLEAASPSEAFQICNHYENAIHLMITDVVMPGMNGQHLAQCFEVLGQEIKVLYMSGYTEDVIVKQGFLDKGAPFINKPFTPENFASRVREVIDN